MKIKALLLSLSAGAALLFNPLATTEPEPTTETETVSTSDFSDADWIEIRGDLQGRFYPATGVITELNEDKNTYIWVDFNGNEWEEIGIEDLSKGDRIALIMNNNGTSEIYDDFAVNIRYVGWVY